LSNTAFTVEFSVDGDPIKDNATLCILNRKEQCYTTPYAVK